MPVMRLNTLYHLIPSTADEKMVLRKLNNLPKFSHPDKIHL